MLQLFLTAWLTGMAGSVHCVAMCGPLALSLPVQVKSRQQRLFLSLLYNAGRICMYVVLGSLLALLNKAIIPWHAEGYFSMFIGVLLMGIAIAQVFFPSMLNRLFSANRWMAPVTQLMSRRFQHKGTANVFFIGLLNGLLPCGLVYLALGAALSTPSLMQSAVYMLGFGLGTLPAMWTVVFFSQQLKSLLRGKWKYLYPLVYLLTGIYLILRGLEFNRNLIQMANSNMMCQ